MISNRKGMSQILSLIIGAAVIMMVAMILIMSATDIIGGGTADAEMDSCIGVIDSQCQIRSQISTPGACQGLSEVEIADRSSEIDNPDQVGDDNIYCDETLL